MCVCVGRNGSWPRVTQSGLEKAAPFSGVCSVTHSSVEGRGRPFRERGGAGVACWRPGDVEGMQPLVESFGFGQERWPSRSVSSSK